MKYIYIFLLFPFFLSAQSEFISNSSFGVKADLVVSLNNDFTGIGGDIGISLSSLFDIGFEYIEASYDPKYNIVSSGRMVYAAYNFRSKNNCLKVLLGYSHNSVSTEYLNLSLLEVTGPLLGIIISPKIYENESIGLLPSLGFSMAFLSATNASGFNNNSGRDHNINVGLEFNVIPKINKEFYFILAPSISKSLSNSDLPLIFGFNLGLLFNIPNQ